MNAPLLDSGAVLIFSVKGGSFAPGGVLGRHVVKLDNPKLDLELSCVVTLVSHRTASLNVDLRSGRCQVIAAH